MDCILKELLETIEEYVVEIRELVSDEYKRNTVKMVDAPSKTNIFGSPNMKSYRIFSVYEVIPNISGIQSRIEYFQFAEYEYRIFS